MEPRIKFEEVPSQLYQLMRNIEGYIQKSSMPHSLYELIKIRASQINGCGFCLDMHHKDAVAAGESIQRLYLLPAWREAPVYTDEERAVLNFTERLTLISQATPSQIAEAFDEVAKYYSKEEIANLILAINQINSWNRLAITLHTVPGSYKPEFSWKFQTESALN